MDSRLRGNDIGNLFRDCSLAAICRFGSILATAIGFANLSDAGKVLAIEWKTS